MTKEGYFKKNEYVYDAIAISVQTIRYCPIVPPTVTDIGSIKVAVVSAKTVHTFRTVQEARIM